MDLKPLPVPASPDPYEVISREAFYDCPWIRIRKDAFKHRAGAEGTYTVVGFHRTACGVLALDDEDRVVLVGQWRYPLERYSWEIPEGGGDPHESPFDAMRRELAEEAGLQARTWEPLLYFNPSNSTTDEETFLFLASGLSPVDGHHAEDDEELALHREPFADCLRRVMNGEIADSLTVAALLTLQARRGGITEPMDAALAERFFQKPAEHPSEGRARWEKL
jgi:8-oxo-dGTP pyrophosphatase MutT (NUDIX family)